MADDVHLELLRTAHAEGKIYRKEAVDFFKLMKAEGRMQTDTWGMYIHNSNAVYSSTTTVYLHLLRVCITMTLQHYWFNTSISACMLYVLTGIAQGGCAGICVVVTVLIMHLTAAYETYSHVCILLCMSMTGVTLHHEEKFAEFAESKYNKAADWLDQVKVILRTCNTISMQLHS